MISRPPLGPWPRRTLVAAALLTGISAVLALNGRAQLAFGTMVLALAAALSVLRQILNRENL